MSELITGRELAEKILKQVVDRPETHRQVSWITSGHNAPVSECGTVACLAGWSVALNAKPGESPQIARMRLAHELGMSCCGWEELGVRLVTGREVVRDMDGVLVYDDQQEGVRAAFFETGDEEQAIKMFAAALGLEVPERG